MASYDHWLLSKILIISIMLLVLLFAVGVSSLSLHPMDETSQIDESNQDSVPLITSMIDHMKDILNDMDAIRELTVKQGCQTSNLFMQEDDPGHYNESLQISCAGSLVNKYYSCKQLCGANSTLGGRMACDSDNWVRYMGRCIVGGRTMDCPAAVATVNDGQHEGVKVMVASTPEQSATVKSGCYHFYETSGSISYPQQGVYYQNNEDVCVVIRSTGIIQIQFTYFDLEPNYDFIYIRAGNHRSAPLLARYSGREVPATIRTTSRWVMVNFVSDYSLRFRGFVFHWTTI